MVALYVCVRHLQCTFVFIAKACLSLSEDSYSHWHRQDLCTWRSSLLSLLPSGETKIPFTFCRKEKSVDWNSQSQAGRIWRSTTSNRGSGTRLKISTSQDFTPIQFNSFSGRPYKIFSSFLEGGDQTCSFFSLSNSFDILTIICFTFWPKYSQNLL